MKEPQPYTMPTSQQKLDEWDGFSPRASRGSTTSPSQFDPKDTSLEHLSSRIWRGYISVALRHPIYGHLLQQPRETNRAEPLSAVECMQMHAEN